MEGWQIMFAAVGVAGTLMGAGALMQRALSSSKSAHHRIDSLEKSGERRDDLLRQEIHELGDRLERMLEQAWMKCPLARSESGHSAKGGS